MDKLGEVMKSLEKAPSVGAKLLDKDSSESILKLVIDPEFNKIITEVNEKYLYWDKVKYIPTHFNHTDIWVVAKLRRTNTPFVLNFGRYTFTWFLNSQLQELLHFFDLNIGGSLESRSLIPQDDKNRYLISSVMEEAIASSQIEGAVTTRRQAKDMLRKNKTPKTKDEQMIFNNYVTIQKILEKKDENITIDSILEIHKLISSKTLSDPKEEGCFRQSNDINVVDVVNGEIVHSPPNYDELNALMKDVCEFFNNDKADFFIHPIVKACIIHFLIGFIHPFVDGNGRTARALFYWYLLKKGYWLTEYISISKLILRSKAQYARAFLYSEIDDNDLTYFIKYNLRTMKLAFESLREYIQRKIEEKKQVAEFIKLKGVNDRQALILKWFYEESSLVLTVKEVERRMAVSNQTARNDLQALVSFNHLESIKMDKKTEAFIKGDNFDELTKSNGKKGQYSLFWGT